MTIETNEQNTELEKYIEKKLEHFKDKMSSLAEDVMENLYCDALPYFEQDLIVNLKKKLMHDFLDYNADLHFTDDFKKLRKKIFDEHKEEIIKHLDQDNLEKIEELKGFIGRLEERLSSRY